MPNNINSSSISLDQHQKENEPFTIDEIMGRPPGWILYSGGSKLVPKIFGVLPARMSPAGGGRGWKINKEVEKQQTLICRKQTTKK